MNLSILIPSKRPNELIQFIKSCEHQKSGSHQIEYVILLDDSEPEPQIDNGSYILIYAPPGITMSARLQKCFNKATGDWIMFGNDDLVCETTCWDEHIAMEIDKLKDNVVLLYPNDMAFGPYFPCFPIVHRELLIKTKFFPQPYVMYKIDDTLMHIIPQHRWVYMPMVIMRHGNVSKREEGKYGFPLSDGRIYNQDKDKMMIDHQRFLIEQDRRVGMAIDVKKMMVK